MIPTNSEREIVKAAGDSAETITLVFKYTEDEYVSATRLFYACKAQTYISFLIPLAIVLIGFAGQLLTGDYSLWFILIFIGFMLIINFWLSYISGPRQLFHSNPMFREEYFMRFSEEGVFFRSSKVEAKYQWSFYSGIWEKSRFFYLFYGTELFSLVPKRVFESKTQELAFKELLQRKVGAELSNQISEKEHDEKVEQYIPPPTPPDWH